MKNLNWVGVALSGLSLCYLSPRNQLKSMISFGTSVGDCDWGISFCMFAMLIMASINVIGEAIASYRLCFLSPRIQLKWVNRCEIKLGERETGVSLWLLSTLVTTNLNFLGEAVASFLFCISPWAQLESIASSGTSLQDVIVEFLSGF